MTVTWPFTLGGTTRVPCLPPPATAASSVSATAPVHVVSRRLPYRAVTSRFYLLRRVQPSHVFNCPSTWSMVMPADMFLSFSAGMLLGGHPTWAYLGSPVLEVLELFVFVPGHTLTHALKPLFELFVMDLFILLLD